MTKERIKPERMIFMVDMKNINARVNELKATNKLLKDDASFDVSHAQQFFQLRNLMQETQKEMKFQLQNGIWNYENPKEIGGWNAKSIRENIRSMFEEAQKWGLEDMRLDSSRVVEVNGKDFLISLENKTLTIIEQFGDCKEVGKFSIDSNYHMVEFYFSMIDNNFEIIRDFYEEYLATGDDVIELYFAASQEPYYAEKELSLADQISNACSNKQDYVLNNKNEKDVVIE